MQGKHVSKGVTHQGAAGVDRPVCPEQTRERRQRLLALLTRAVSIADVEQAVRRLRPQVDRTN